MKRILITGANGFVGSFIVEEALDKGYEVYAAVRLGSDLRFIENKEIKLLYPIYADENELVSLFKSQEQFDYIIHNAGVTKTNRESDFDLVNFQYTKNLVNALINAGKVPDRFIYVSSLAAAGPGDEKTIVPIIPDSEPNPANAYGRSKLKAEKFLNSTVDFPYTVLRPTAVYGPREKDILTFIRLISKRLEFRLTRKRQHLSFIYVKDLARLIVDAVNVKGNNTYLVSDGNTYSFDEFSAAIRSALKRKTLRIHIPGFVLNAIGFVAEKYSALTRKTSPLSREKLSELTVSNWICDISKTQKDFGFIPAYNLKTGLEETVAWYKQNKWI